MDKIIDFLDGKKTVIGAAVIFLAGGLKAIGKITEDQFQSLLAVGAAIAAIGLRMALKKLE